MELSKPCHLIEETDAFVVYEFRTGFLYLLYGILLTIGVGYFFTQQNPIRCGYIQILREFGGCNRLRHRVHAACAEFRVVFVLADRFFPAPATAALSPFGLSDRIGGGLSACVFGEF